jgi:hypothetical protein
VSASKLCGCPLPTQLYERGAAGDAYLSHPIFLGPTRLSQRRRVPARTFLNGNVNTQEAAATNCIVCLMKKPRLNDWKAGCICSLIDIAVNVYCVSFVNQASSRLAALTVLPTFSSHSLVLSLCTLAQRRLAEYPCSNCQVPRGLDIRRRPAGLPQRPTEQALEPLQIIKIVTPV